MYIQSTLLFGDIAPLGQYIRVRDTIDRRNDQILGVGLILIFKVTKAIFEFLSDPRPVIAWHCQ